MSTSAAPDMTMIVNFSTGRVSVLRTPEPLTTGQPDVSDQLQAARTSKDERAAAVRNMTQASKGSVFDQHGAAQRRLRAWSRDCFPAHKAERENIPAEIRPVDIREGSDADDACIDRVGCVHGHVAHASDDDLRALGRKIDSVKVSGAADGDRQVVGPAGDTAARATRERH